MHAGLAAEEDQRRAFDLHLALIDEEDQRRQEDLLVALNREEDSRRTGDLNRGLAAEESLRRANREVARLNARQATATSIPFSHDLPSTHPGLTFGPRRGSDGSFIVPSGESITRGMAASEQSRRESQYRMTGGAEMSEIISQWTYDPAGAMFGATIGDMVGLGTSLFRDDGLTVNPFTGAELTAEQVFNAKFGLFTAGLGEINLAASVIGRGASSLPNSLRFNNEGSTFNQMVQGGTRSGLENYIPPRSAELGEITSIAELRATAAFPGPDGVPVAGGVTLDDLFDLATLNGRQVEFGIGTRANSSGAVENIVVSGGYRNGVPSIGFPDDIYPIAHVHPVPGPLQHLPSSADLSFMQGRVSGLLQRNPGATIPPHHIVYGRSGAYTSFSPLPFNYFSKP